jgi:acyl carrier protein
MSMNAADIRRRVRSYVASNFYIGPQPLADEASLLELGVVDSTGVLELVAFLERTFGLEVRDEELVPENLDSIDAICEFVSRKGGR